MRGKGLEKLAHERRRGITPAYAGKSTPWWYDCSQCKGHPRVCGEKTFAVWENVPGAGSPPHVRGKASTNGLYPTFAGITPACAGKSHWESLRRSPPEDHPRVCGEKSSKLRLAGVESGSPPRVRGKGGRTGSSGRYTGITPAYAGKSDKHQRARSWLGDYPRVCGEKSHSFPLAVAALGSPPRVRGKVLW